MSYYVISLKHTGKKDKYVTLWRDNDCGYCWPIEWAGEYKRIEDGYHNDHRDGGGNYVVTIESIQKYLVPYAYQEGLTALPNTKEVIKFIKQSQL